MGTLKLIHMTCAVLSLVSFILRGIWMMKASPLLQHKIVKISPHIIDTLLLVSAITLAVQFHLSPMVHTWLMAKIIALCLYIALGLVALRFGKTMTVRLTAWAGAIVVFFYIMSVAGSKSPLGFFAPLF